MEEHLISTLSPICSDVIWGEIGEGLGLPRLVLSNVSGADALRLDGRSGVVTARVQIDCYAASPYEALQISRQVRNLLSGYSGGPIVLARLDGRRDGRDGSDGDSIPRVSLDFAVRYRD